MLFFFDKFLPDSSTADSDFVRRARLLLASSVVFFVVCLFFAVLMLLMGTYPDKSIAVLFVAAGLGLLNPVLLRLTGSHVVPGTLLCLEIIALISFQALFDLGLNDPVLLWLVIIPWLAAFLIRPHFGFLFTGVVLTVAGGFFWLEMHGYAFPRYSAPEELAWLFFLQLSLVALSIGTLGWIYEGQTLRNLREANQDLRRARDALQQSKRRTESILESITDGFLALDYEGRLTYINHQAERLFDRDREPLLGESAREHLADRVGKNVLVYFRQAVQEREPKEFELYFEPLDRWLEVRIYPFADGLSVYFSDISERKEYERRLIKARDAAEELAHLKSTFLANVSHEIRTPLSGILGFANVLARELEGEYQEFAELIDHNANRLLNTLNAVLDLSQLESGSVQVSPEPLDVVEEVKEVVQLLTPLTAENDLYLRTEYHLEDRTAVIDPTCLHRVLNNLIGNAIKFTEEGGVTVCIEGNAEEVVLRVQDTGIGIDDAFLPHLFEEFRQESTGSSRSHQGSGLGLAITKRLVEAMDGSIEVESKKHAGSTFTVRLPRRKKVTQTT